MQYNHEDFGHFIYVKICFFLKKNHSYNFQANAFNKKAIVTTETPKPEKLNATAPQWITINHQKLTSGEKFSLLPPVFINGAYSTSESIKAAAGQCA